jgi:hypothetical protein
MGSKSTSTAEDNELKISASFGSCVPEQEAAIRQCKIEEELKIQLFVNDMPRNRAAVHITGDGTPPHGEGEITLGDGIAEFGTKRLGNYNASIRIHFHDDRKQYDPYTYAAPVTLKEGDGIKEIRLNVKCCDICDVLQSPRRTTFTADSYTEYIWPMLQDDRQKQLYAIAEEVTKKVKEAIPYPCNTRQGIIGSKFASAVEGSYLRTNVMKTVTQIGQETQYVPQQPTDRHSKLLAYMKREDDNVLDVMKDSLALENANKPQKERLLPAALSVEANRRFKALRADKEYYQKYYVEQGHVDTYKAYYKGQHDKYYQYAYKGFEDMERQEYFNLIDEEAAYAERANHKVFLLNGYFAKTHGAGACQDLASCAYLLLLHYRLEKDLTYYVSLSHGPHCVVEVTVPDSDLCPIIVDAWADEPYPVYKCHYYLFGITGNSNPAKYIRCNQQENAADERSEEYIRKKIASHPGYTNLGGCGAKLQELRKNLKHLKDGTGDKSELESYFNPSDRIEKSYFDSRDVKKYWEAGDKEYHDTQGPERPQRFQKEVEIGDVDRDWFVDSRSWYAQRGMSTDWYKEKFEDAVKEIIT